MDDARAVRQRDVGIADDFIHALPLVLHGFERGLRIIEERLVLGALVLFAELFFDDFVLLEEGGNERFR